MMILFFIRCNFTKFSVIKNKHHRVVRECGYERSPKDCYKADNDFHLEMVCQCWTDGCNGAERIEFSPFVAIGVAFGVVLRLLGN